MNPEWKCCVDAFGRQYIYNEKLKCSRWLWERYYDANTKHFYLCNVLTGQSIWEPTTAAVQTPVATSVTMQGRTANPTTTENGNQVAFFTPDGRKYYWDPITKTSQWATTETTTNEGKNQPNTKKDGHRFHHHHAPPVTPSKQPTTDAWRISLAWKPKQPLEKPPQLETTCFKQPKLETRDDISENTILQTCDQNWETGIDTSIHSTTQATGGNQLDKSISKTIVDSKQNVDSNESGKYPIGYIPD